MSQHLRTLVHRDISLNKVLILNKILRNSRRINHKIHFVGNLGHIPFEMNFRSLNLQHFCYSRRSQVVAGDAVAILQEILR